MGMRKFCLLFLSLIIGVNTCNAAVRAQNNISRKTQENTSVRQKNTAKKVTVSRAANTRNQKTQQKTENNNSTQRKTVSRTTATKTIVARPAKTITRKQTLSAPSYRVSRNAITAATLADFGDNYNSCRDAYFSCMDQFCANQNDTYRRCVCSSKLAKIQSQESLLSQTATRLEDFHDLNIDAISKTSDEVKSMLTATDGEKSIKKDTSNAGTTLQNISDVLQKSKKKSLSTTGQMDIAGDIKSIWTTTNFINGSNIANLTGESLYNAVHAQCSEIVSQNCSDENLKMITSTYGMYIENDCSMLADTMHTKMTAANASIRTTRNEMHDARLENYNAHNSLTTNDCIAKVRSDITAPAACGEGYIHCLDLSGKYLNITTGEPIYSPDFYELENILSLSGDILRNAQNTQIVNELNKKRSFAQQSLDLCVDNADEVWNEFLRQSIVEIYQAQQSKVQSVRSECLHVVNECYLNKSDSLNKFSDTASEILLGHTLELSEAMCADKLTTCSNLYGGGPEGLTTLINTMTEITDQTIAQTCPALLTTFAENICAVSANDSAHAYPYGCRTYTPGEAIYAHNEICNSTMTNPFFRSEIIISEYMADPYAAYYVCPITTKRYIDCKYNYYLYNPNEHATACISGGMNGEEVHDSITRYCRDAATECHICPPGYICAGGKNPPTNPDSTLYENCGVNYIGSLYQQFVRYALQNCTRPSDDSYQLSETLLADVDVIVKRVQSALIAELSKECSRYDGTWVDIPWQDENYDAVHDTTGDKLLEKFYSETGTNRLWGYCK